MNGNERNCFDVPLNQSLTVLQMRSIPVHLFRRHPQSNCSLFDLFEIQSKPIKKVWLSDLMIRRSARPINLLLCFAPKRQYRISKTFHRTHTHKNTFNRFQRLSWLFCNDCPKRLYLPLSLSHYLYLLLHLEQKPQIVGGLTIILLHLVQVEKGTELSVFVFRVKKRFISIINAHLKQMQTWLIQIKCIDYPIYFHYWCLTFYKEEKVPVSSEEWVIKSAQVVAMRVLCAFSHSFCHCHIILTKKWSKEEQTHFIDIISFMCSEQTLNISDD